MIVEPPKTLEDFEGIKKTILELMENPFCDEGMRLTLTQKLNKINAKIEELKSQNNLD